MVNRHLTREELAFFAGHEEALPIYEAFRSTVIRSFPETGMRVQKTQITLTNRRVFACVSFMRVLRKALMPHAYIVVTLGLSTPLSSDRVAAKVEPYPGRWSHHIVVGDEEEIDDELLGWVAEAYDFAQHK